jgi:hypothetical protein
MQTHTEGPLRQHATADGRTSACGARPPTQPMQRPAACPPPPEEVVLVERLHVPLCNPRPRRERRHARRLPRRGPLRGAAGPVELAQLGLVPALPLGLPRGLGGGRLRAPLLLVAGLRRVGAAGAFGSPLGGGAVGLFGEQRRRRVETEGLEDLLVLGDAGVALELVFGEARGGVGGAARRRRVAARGAATAARARSVDVGLLSGGGAWHIGNAMCSRFDLRLLLQRSGLGGQRCEPHDLCFAFLSSYIC